MARLHNVDPSFPEHKKAALIKEESQAVGSFLDWLQNQRGLTLCILHEHSKECYEGEDEEDGNVICGTHDGEDYVPAHVTIEKLLAEYYKIDLDVLEDEKMFMLKQLQKGAKQ